MNRDEQLTYCTVCTHKAFDKTLGYICELTNDQADFQDRCENYVEDKVLKEKETQRKKENSMDSKLASSGKRFANFFLDMIFIYIIGSFIGIMIFITFSMINPDAITMFDEMNSMQEYILGFVIGTVYYTFFEFLTGRSLAKFITGTKVVDENGNKPEFRSLLIRSMCRYIPFEPFSFLGSNKEGWHDQLSHTRVIDLRKI